MRPSGFDRLIRSGNCRTAVAVAAMASACSATGAGGLPCSYSVETYSYDCGWPFPDGAAAYGIAPNSGVVVGAWQDCATAEGNHTFLWPPGGDGVEPIPYPPGVNHMNGYDVSDAGWVVGGMGPGSDQEIYAFLHKDGVTTDLGVPPGGWKSVAHAIAANGTIVGEGMIDGVPNPRALRWQDGVLSDITLLLGTAKGAAYDIAENGLVTGWGGTLISDARAFILNGDRVTFLPLPPGASKSEGRAINSRGDVAGRILAGDSRAYAYLDGKSIVLPELPGDTGSLAYDLNDNRFIVGYSDSALGVRAVIWKDAHVYDLNDLIAPGSNVIVKYARAISAGGIITGYGESLVTYTNIAVRLTPVWPAAGDFNCDQIVNGFDLALLLGQWGACRSETCSADLSSDGVVNGVDLALLLGLWG